MKTQKNNSKLFARIHTFDGEIETNFDISTYLGVASLREIIEMQDSDWSYCRAFRKALEENAIYDTDCARALDHIDSSDCDEGFDVDLDPNVVVDWFKNNRPEMFSKLRNHFGGVEYGGFEINSWDVMDDYCYDKTQPRGEVYYQNPYSFLHDKIRVRWRVGVESIDSGSFVVEIKSKKEWRPILLAEKLTSIFDKETKSINYKAFNSLNFNTAVGPSLNCAREFAKKITELSGDDKPNNIFIFHSMMPVTYLNTPDKIGANARTALWLFIKKFLDYRGNSLTVMATTDNNFCHQKEMAYGLKLKENLEEKDNRYVSLFSHIGRL